MKKLFVIDFLYASPEIIKAETEEHVKIYLINNLLAGISEFNDTVFIHEVEEIIEI